MDKKYLLQRRQGWYVRVRVPDSLYPLVGKRHITRSLKTRDIIKARVLRWEAVAKIKGELDVLAGHAEDTNSLPVRSILSEPKDFLNAAKAIRGDIDSGRVDAETASNVWGHVVDQALNAAGKPKDTETGHFLSTGHDVEAAIETGSDMISGVGDDELISDLLDCHITELKLRARNQTVRARRKMVGSFLDWLGGDRFIRRVQKRDAGNYVTKVLMRQGRAPKTIRDELSGLGAFFNWCVHRGAIDVNPFAGLSRSIRDSSRGKEDNRREWTRAELQGILTAMADDIGRDDPLWALSVISLYTGMRGDEVAELEITDVHDDRLHIPEGKTKSSVRDVPIHPVIAPLIGQLKEKSTDGYLIPGLKPGGDDNKRYHRSGNRFVYYRRKWGFSDPRTVFHSFRKSFIGSLERVGIPVTTTKQIVGAPRKARRIWSGESPGMVRVNHPPLPSVAPLAERWLRKGSAATGEQEG